MMTFEQIQMLLFMYFESEGLKMETDSRTGNISTMRYVDHPHMPVIINITHLARFMVDKS